MTGMQRSSYILERPGRSTIGVNIDFEIHGMDLKDITTIN
jgi:hypothetical protein